MTARLTSGERGFTLLETLVALSVLSIAALALIRLDAFAVATAADLSAHQVAGVTVRNRAIELLTDPRAPAIGQRSVAVTNGGRAMTVTENVAATADPALLRIDLIASADGARAALTIVRPAQ